MRLSDTAECKCGATRETITHVIYECPPPTRRSPDHYRGGRPQVGGPVLYTRGVEPLGRIQNWTTNGWAKGEQESGPPSGKDSSSLPMQDRKVRWAGMDG
jgi:hypothetical protein